MGSFRLYEAVGEIDDSLLLDAETAWERGTVRKKSRTPWLAAAVCFLLVTAAVCWPRPGGTAPMEDRLPAAGGENTDGAACFPADEAQSAALAFNDLDAAPDAGASAMISLGAEDFVPMSREEVLDYFGAGLPVEEALPELALTGGGCFGGGFGVYRTGERGTYFDVNTFSFADAAGDRTVSVSLRTTFLVSPCSQTITAGPEKLAFTRVKGWDLTVFRYIGEDGRSRCRTEFWQNGAAWSVETAGLTEEELARLLEALLEEKPAVDGPRTASGTVSWVDGRYGDSFDGQDHHYTESHDYIRVELDGGGTLTVWLPGEADQYAEGDRVTVTYTGEPATIRNLWPGQIDSVEKE